MVMCLDGLVVALLFCRRRAVVCLWVMAELCDWVSCCQSQVRVTGTTALLHSVVP